MLRSLAALAKHHTGRLSSQMSRPLALLTFNSTCSAPLHATAALTNCRTMRPADKRGVKP